MLNNCWLVTGGSGKGISVSEMLNITGSNLVPQLLDRRPGDCGMVVADPTKVVHLLGFKAQQTLKEMISSVL